MGWLPFSNSRLSRFQQLAIRVFLLIVVGGGLTFLFVSRDTDHATAESAHPTFSENDAISDLQRKIEGGTKLEYDADRGYLESLLDHLNIPVSSQTLVFSKSSFQLDLISPEAPRAIYFNDDVYVGWVQGGRVLEIAAVDPKLGPLFYTLNQENPDNPEIVRQADDCLVCHNSSSDPTTTIPRLVVLSVLPNPLGNALKAASLLTTDRSAFHERWGGWYVTGTHGRGHMGNVTVRTSADAIRSISDYMAQMDLRPGANVTDLSRYFDTKPYLTPHSDIVALLVLAHQTHVHNLIALAGYEILRAQKAKSEGENTIDLDKFTEEITEPLVRTLLFSGAAPIPGPIKGTTRFAEEFVRDARRDSRGRSLRDLDLQTRLLRYPLSYLIYSASFDQMPDVARKYVYRRLREVLTGQDKSEDFVHLSQQDRTAILEILNATKPDFAAVLSN